jgi:hypothetical protein
MLYSKNTRLAFLQKARQIKPSPLSSAVEGGASDGLFLKKPLLEMAVAKKLVAKNPIVKEKFGRMSGRTPLRILSVQTSEQDFDASCCIPCNQCGHLIREDAMVLHYENNHSEPVKGNSRGLPDTNFPFELLPAGTWEFRHALEYGYNRLRSPHGYWDQRFDQGRIDSMKLLNPNLTHIGRKAWSGYAVYEFSYSKRVVLECPIEGNATYVLSGDWKKMISLTKAEVRRGHTGRLTRIFHTVNWLSRVRQALRY